MPEGPKSLVSGSCLQSRARETSSYDFIIKTSNNDLMSLK